MSIEKMSIEKKFNKATKDIKGLNDLDNDNLLYLYGLYKQVTCGDCNVSKPGFFDFKGQAKWKAWESRKGLKKELAQQKYIDKVESLLSTNKN
jgi:diazepam-binding inhibitor (GABA receptor modulating acyl-CoA-binding protein)